MRDRKEKSEALPFSEATISAMLSPKLRTRFPCDLTLLEALRSPRREVRASRVWMPEVVPSAFDNQFPAVWFQKGVGKPRHSPCAFDHVNCMRVVLMVLTTGGGEEVQSSGLMRPSLALREEAQPG